MARYRSGRSKTRRTPRILPRGIIKVTPAGYAFVQTAEGEYFIPASKTADAFDGDTVDVAPLAPTDRAPRGSARAAAADRRMARVVSVALRAHETLVGRYEVAEPFGVVIPEDPRIHHDIFTLRADAPQVRDGDIVRVRIVSYPDRREPASGVVEEVLGHEGDAGIDVSLVIARHKLETRFSDAALADVAACEVGARQALDSEGYRDLRERLVFTIDPIDARDFDDALSISRMDDATLRLGVHIADVAHYVPWNSPVDLDARRRATSVYLVDRVIPMLPEKLSNDVCSLRPDEERRTMTVDMYFDSAMRLVRTCAYPAVIESKARLSYDQVQAALDGSEWAKRSLSASPEVAEEIFAAIREINRVANALHDERYARGGLDFDSVEAKAVLDDTGAPIDVRLRTRSDATALVEEAMIAANEAVARLLEDAKFPCLFRVHDAPDCDELAALVPLLHEFGYSDTVSTQAFSVGDPRAIQAVLKAAEGRPEEYLVSSLVLRCMKRAVYRSECGPHFGLASLAYAHFTSPIRRYPDLVVHRMLKMLLTKRDGTYTAQADSLGWLAEHCSKAERTAEAAARDSQELKLLELLSQHIGEEFDGIISGVSSSGFYVRLDTTVEGFVSVRGAHDYYMLDAVRHQLIGSETRKKFRLGKRVRIKVKDVHPLEHRADFELAGHRL